MVEVTFSKFGGDPCPVRQGLAAAVKCYVRKHVLSLLLNRTREARALCGFRHHKGENLFCSLFSDTIIVGLKPEKTQRKVIIGKRRHDNKANHH